MALYFLNCNSDEKPDGILAGCGRILGNSSAVTDRPESHGWDCLCAIEGKPLAARCVGNGFLFSVHAGREDEAAIFHADLIVLFGRKLDEVVDDCVLGVLKQARLVNFTNRAVWKKRADLR